MLNPTQKNGLGFERGFILVPGPNSVPYALKGSLARRRASFMDHHFWVTRYRPGELYVGGDPAGFFEANPALDVPLPH